MQLNSRRLGADEQLVVATGGRTRTTAAHDARPAPSAERDARAAAARARRGCAPARAGGAPGAAAGRANSRRNGSAGLRLRTSSLSCGQVADDHRLADAEDERADEGGGQALHPADDGGRVGRHDEQAERVDLEVEARAR